MGESEGTAGTFKLNAGKWFASEEADKGIQTQEDSKFFGISASFDSFSNKGKDLIIQYQAKYEKDVECGGGYVKIGPKMSDPTTFGDPTAYNIMFGPDKCGYNKRTHLIFNYDGKNVLKKSDLSYKQDNDGTSHLYTLIVKPDNTCRVEVDQEKIYEGSIKEDWEVLKPKKISDPEDKKPEDWSDDSMIDDPEDKKPDDWVEEKRIVDADAKKPEDWDDEEDGEWEPPMKDNPEFKDDDSVYEYADFGFLGFDLWQVKGGTIFDNVILCDDVAEADEFAKKWKALNEVEKAKKKEEDDAKKAAEPADAAGDDDDDDDDDEKAEEE